MCRNIFALSLLLFQFFTLAAQDTLRYSREECETVFLQENLLLLAAKLNISKAEAALQQAKLWPNPTLTFDQVNFWSTPSQTGGNEVVPPLWNGFGRNQQFAVEAEQLIRTAGKRKKLIALEEVGIDKAGQYFLEILRNLKTEFRNQLTELQYLQLQQAMLRKQLLSIRQITAAYDQQVQQGNIPKNQLVRLRAQELEITQDLNNWKMKTHDVQSNLKTLMHLPPQVILIIEDHDFDQPVSGSNTMDMEALLSKAKTNRPDLHIAKLEEIYHDKRYQYEKALRVPDVYLKGNYDRNGSTMLNFVGFGVAVDLPFFNRNQGNIRTAELDRQQSSLHILNAERSIENELIKSYQNYIAALDFRKQIDPDYVQALDEMLDAYTRNFQQQNISVMEYIDFLEAYLENRKSILEAARSLRNMAEELNYTVGADVIQL